mgnify:CR=1 FL=1
MSITIKNSDSPEEINKKIEQLYQKMNRKPNKKKYNLLDYVGKLKGVYGDGLTYQKEIRNEWGQ